MDDDLGVHIDTEVIQLVLCASLVPVMFAAFLPVQGCEATWCGRYAASAPVIEILQDYCEHFGLSAAACKLYANRKEVPKSKLLGQVLYCQGYCCYRGVLFSL